MTNMVLMLGEHSLFRKERTGQEQIRKKGRERETEVFKYERKLPCRNMRKRGRKKGFAQGTIHEDCGPLRKREGKKGCAKKREFRFYWQGGEKVASDHDLRRPRRGGKGGESPEPVSLGAQPVIYHLRQRLFQKSKEIGP